MKKVEIIGNKEQPEYQKAIAFIEAIKEENDTYRPIEIAQKEAYQKAGTESMSDYFKLPAIFIDGKLEHEGVTTKEIMRTILDKALE